MQSTLVPGKSNAWETVIQWQSAVAGCEQNFSCSGSRMSVPNSCVCVFVFLWSLFHLVVEVFMTNKCKVEAESQLGVGPGAPPPPRGLLPLSLRKLPI